MLWDIEKSGGMEKTWGNSSEPVGVGYTTKATAGSSVVNDTVNDVSVAEVVTPETPGGVLSVGTRPLRRDRPSVARYQAMGKFWSIQSSAASSSGVAGSTSCTMSTEA